MKYFKNVDIIPVVLAFLTMLYTSATAQGIAICPGPEHQIQPAICGHRIVWVENMDIHMYDLVTCTETVICDARFEQIVPAISGERIVWQDRRRDPDSFPATWDIYMWDLTTHTEMKIGTPYSEQFNPAISGNRIAWSDMRNGFQDIYLCELNDGSQMNEIRITTDEDHNQILPDISGDYIVWADFRSGTNVDIYCFDLSAGTQGTEIPVCTHPTNQHYPAISGNTIVWQDRRNGNWDIYMCDISTGTPGPAVAVCREDGDQIHPAISGHVIVWQDDSKELDSDIYMCDISTGIPGPAIAVCEEAGHQFNPAISGRRIVWQDRGQGGPDWDIYMYTIPGQEIEEMTLLVASHWTDNILRYDGLSGEFIDEFVPSGSGGLDGPWQAIFGPDDNLYVCSICYNEGVFQGRIIRYDGTTGDLLDVFVESGNFGFFLPRCLEFGRDGYLYVSSGNNVLRFDAETGDFDKIFVPYGSGGLDSPNGLIFGPDGHLYVCNQLTDCVLRFDGTTGEFDGDFVHSGSGGLDEPIGLVFGPDGNLYVSSKKSHSILRYDGETGDFMGPFVEGGGLGLQSPKGLVFGPDGNLYVCSWTWASVMCYDGVTGEFLGNFVEPESGGLNGPQWPIFYIPDNTPVGEDIVVQPAEPGSEETPVTLTFDQVTDAGFTNLNTTTQGEVPPSGFKLGDPPMYYDISTTAVFSGLIEICIEYSDISYDNEEELRLFHFVNGEWVDITTSIDTEYNIICGVTDHFSVFTVFEREITIDYILSFFDESVADGKLEGIGPGKSAENRLNALRNMLVMARDLIIAGDNASAWEQLQDAYYKIDNNPLPPDFVAGEAAPEVATMIQDLMAFIATETLSKGQIPEVAKVKIPSEFSLFQNNPNPFNPETTISYTIPEQSDVTIEIYNIVGEKVTTIVNAQVNAGYHSVIWDGRNSLGKSVTGGIYLARIQAGKFSQTIRMLYLK